MRAALTALSEKPAKGAPAVRGEQSPYSVVVVRDVESLRAHVPAWEELARRAAEPNAFYEPWALLPALRAFGKDVFFVLVYLPVNAQRRQPVLCGFFPLTRRRHGLVHAVELWKHKYACMTVPMLRTGHAGAVLDAFFEWMRTDPLGGALWHLDEVSLDGPFALALTDILYERQRPSFDIEAYCRARIEPAGDAETYLRRALSGRRLREFRRKERALKSHGELETRVLEPGGDVELWTEQFLRLEAAGWKGQEGTAICCDPADAGFFRDMVRGAFERGQLMMLGLFLNGEPVAMKVNFLANEGSFAFKIAFDEAHAASSPGVLLEMANIEYLHQKRTVKWMDSCAIPNHVMINRLWIERLRIKSQYIATGRALGDFLVALMPLGRWLKHKFRKASKPIVHFIREED